MPYRLRKRLVKSLTNRNLDKPQLPTKIRRTLIDIYRNNILELEEIIERDLSGWLEK